MKYVPVMRYRREERAALRSISLSNKIMPLIEIMKERANQKHTGGFESYIEDFSIFKTPFMVDFPLYFHITNSTTDNIKTFLRDLKVNSSKKIGYFGMLSSNKYLIPVISYDTENPYPLNMYINEFNLLSKLYPRIAFRIFESNDRSIILNEIKGIIRSQDILLYDIDDFTYTQDIIQAQIKLINQIKYSTNCTIVMIRSAISPSIVFNRLTDNQPVTKADNSLLKAYKNYGFDAFGDFAGVRKDATITDGGPSEASPGFLFYSWHSNSYIGYKGRKSEWSEFTQHIQPTLTKSTYWNSFSTLHQKNCPGCANILSNPTNGAANWKRYAIQHYLVTMEEFLT